jgi:hypothetical protein
MSAWSIEVKNAWRFNIRSVSKHQFHLITLEPDRVSNDSHFGILLTLVTSASVAIEPIRTLRQKATDLEGFGQPLEAITDGCINVSCGHHDVIGCEQRLTVGELGSEGLDRV